MRCALICPPVQRLGVLTIATAKLRKKSDICKRLAKNLLIDGQMLAIIVINGVNIEGKIIYYNR